MELNAQIEKARVSAKYYFQNQQDREDFVQWYALNLLEGQGQHQTVQQAAYDFKRKTYGDIRGQKRSMHRRDHFDTLRKINEFAAPTPHEAEVFLSKCNLKRRQRQAIELTCLQQYNHIEAGAIMGCTGSRVTQLLAEARKIIQRDYLI